MVKVRMFFETHYNFALSIKTTKQTTLNQFIHLLKKTPMNSLKNKVNLIGRLGAKPEKKEGEGYTLVRVTLATNENFKDKSGEWKTTTIWNQLVAWGKTADRMCEFLDKGVEVAIEGRLVQKTFETKDGVKRTSVEVEVSDFLLIPSKKSSNQEVLTQS